MAAFQEFTDTLPGISISLLIGVVVGLYVIGSYVYSWHRLRHIPGPSFAKWSYLWMFRQSMKGRQGALYRSVTDKYGHLARIGPNDLITDDPEIVRRMSAARSPYSRSNWYNAMRMNPHRDSMFSMTNTTVHDKLKAQMSFGYGGKENPTIEDGIDEQLVNLLSLIRRKYISTDKEFKPLDLAIVIQYFTLDALTRIAYGKDFGYLETDSDVYSYIKMTENFVPILVMLAELPVLGAIFFSPFMLRILGPKPTDETGVGKLVG